jgi:hypothetical protein
MKGQLLVVFRRVALRAGFGLALAGLVIVALRSGDLGLAARAALHVGPWALVSAMAITMFSMILTGIVWARVLRCMGYQESMRVGITVYVGTGLASYVGMAAGAVGGSVLLLRRRGVCGGHAALLIGIASMVGFCGALVWAPCGVALLAAPAALHGLPALGAYGPVIALAATVACAAGTVVGLWLSTLAPRLSSRRRIARLFVNPAAPSMPLHLHRLLALVPSAAIAWLVGTGPLWVLVRAAAPQIHVTLPSIIAIQALAAVGGSMTFFLPNGLGTRDGIIVALLTGVMGVPVPAAAAVTALMRMSDPLGKALILLMLAGIMRARALRLSPPACLRALGDAAQATFNRRAFGAGWTEVPD